ncbi:MAG: hypothetical protein JWQ14_2866 [Adhaeribacter sp.]|nr:hypothetical protein [Adhaeribacter sp.]
MKELSDKSKPQSLEEIFRARMEAAEATPPDRMWERIEQGLDAGYYKERVTWYKSLAAACIALVVCAALYVYYDVNTQHNGAGTKLATLSQNNNTSDLATTKSAQIPVKSAPERKEQEIKNSHLAETATANPGKTLPAQSNLAAVQPAPENKPAITKSGLTKPAKLKDNEKNTYAATRLGSGKLNQSHIAASGDIFERHVAVNNYQASSGITALRKHQVMAGIAADKRDDSLEPLVSVNTWASLAQMAPAADSLWKPRAIEAVPPALASVSNPTPEPEKAQLKRWSFSTRYAPQYFNQNLALADAVSPQSLMASPNNNFNSAPSAAVNASGYTQALNEFDKNTTSGYSYNMAAAAGYALNEHWSIESGVLFTQNVALSQSSYVFNNSYLAARYNNASQSNFFNDTKNAGTLVSLPATALVASLSGQHNLANVAVIQTPAFETEYRYRSVGVPVKLNYQTKKRKSFYFASVGLLTNLLVQAHVISESSRVPDIKFGNSPESPFRTWQFATVLSAGKGYQISKSISLKAGLEGTQYLTSLVAHPENLNGKQRKPYSIGLAFSSSYTLGK